MGEIKQARTELQQTSAQFPELPEAKLQVAALDLQEKNFKSTEQPRHPEGALYQPSEATGVVGQTHGVGL